MCEARRQLVTAADLAVEFGVPTSTLHDIARRHRWPRFKIGHSVRFDPDEIRSLLRQEPDEPTSASDHSSAAIVRRLRAAGSQGGR